MKIERIVKTLDGISKTRKGRIPAKLHTLIARNKSAEFIDDDIALDAAKALSKSPQSRVQRTLENSALSGAAGPLITGAARGVKGLLDAKKGRFRGALDGIKDTTRGGFASDSVRGALTGAVLTGGRDRLEMRHARNTVDDYLKQHGVQKAAQDVLETKLAAAFGMPKLPTPGMPRLPTTSAAAAGKPQNVAAIKGIASNNSRKPPGTSFMSQVTNPRRSVASAMSPKPSAM
jgi:hypothetical protein